MVDWQLLECRGPLEQPRGGRPSPQDPGVDLGLTSRQAPERVLVGKLAQVGPELALDERAKRSRGRNARPCVASGMRPFESTASTRTALTLAAAVSSPGMKNAG